MIIAAAFRCFEEKQSENIQWYSCGCVHCLLSGNTLVLVENDQTIIMVGDESTKVSREDRAPAGTRPHPLKLLRWDHLVL
jgi:hypothetical protein